ncbi:MAG: hypothetical protein ABGF52_07995 [Candidatus Asgardarchaeum sp.]
MVSKAIPKKFIKWAFYERRELVLKMLNNKLTQEDTLVGFLRHTPAIITHGPAGLNASIKGVGFVVKEEFLKDSVEKLKEALNKNIVLKERIRLLLETVYDDEKVDFYKLSTIELAKKHTWINLQDNNDATILFFMPPSTTYEVRCKATIHTDDLYWEFVNAVHDLFHVTPDQYERREWKETPVYIFEIKEIYDNNPNVMGEKIF